jgi:hypothetical protein
VTRPTNKFKTGSQATDFRVFICELSCKGIGGMESVWQKALFHTEFFVKNDPELSAVASLRQARVPILFEGCDSGCSPCRTSA